MNKGKAISYIHVTHHYNSHYEDWYSNQPEETHNDVHTTSSSILVCAWIVLKEPGTIEVTTGKLGTKEINSIASTCKSAMLTLLLAVVFQWN